MLSNKLNSKPIITINEFLELYDNKFSDNLEKLLHLDFKLNLNHQYEKINPVIHLAKPEDAKKIAQIFKDIYEGTYPYKQMEDYQEIKEMIKSSNYHWYLLKINSNKTVGCFGTYLEFEKKRGLLFGFVIEKQYQNILDSLKAFIGCLIYIWSTYKNKILVWFGEIRTNDPTPQYATSLCSLRPIAFYPNKDIFLNNIESIFLHVTYDEKALLEFRYKRIPKIIRQVLDCYLYSNNRFHLGAPLVKNPKININLKKVSTLQTRFFKRTEKDKFDNEIITFSIKKSVSYFKFLYNQNLKTIEKTNYKITKLEELYVYLQELNKFITKSHIRYIECFVSSYKPKHQKIFFNAGFKPRGYVFSWEYNMLHKVFEDRIVFNYYEGEIDKNIKLIPETLKLLKVLNFNAYRKTNFFKG